MIPRLRAQVIASAHSQCPVRGLIFASACLMSARHSAQRCTACPVLMSVIMA